jgi:hypothetical protein
MTTADKLAAALRAVMGCADCDCTILQGCGAKECAGTRYAAAQETARAALAEYDAEREAFREVLRGRIVTRAAHCERAMRAIASGRGSLGAAHAAAEHSREAFKTAARLARVGGGV